ncbi:MAG: hypothetical protein QG573_2131 [Acidobacteriota bacterium]|nr:hypothetical protein [Acidobacteriota bacterium]
MDALARVLAAEALLVVSFSVPAVGGEGGNVVDLAPGTTISRAVAAGETHLFSTALTAGELFEVRADELGADLALGLYGPDGTRLAGMDGPLGGQGAEILSWIVEATGEYRLEARVVAASAGASLIVSAAAAQPATAAESRRIAVQSLFGRAGERLERGDASAKVAALALFEGALEAARAAGERWLEARSLLAVGWLESATGRSGAALGHLEESACLWQELGEARFAARALDWAGYATQALGRHREGAGFHRRAAALWRSAGALAEVATALVYAGYCASFDSDFAVAIPELEEAVLLAQEVGAEGTAATALNNLGLAQRGNGELRAALASFAVARPFAEAAGNRALGAELHANRGNVLSDLGELEAAIDEYQLAVQGYRAAGNKRGEGQALSYIGSVWAVLGEQSRALAAFEPALAALRSIGHSYQAVVLHRMGTAHHELRQLAAAADDFTAALEIWRAHHLRWGEAMTLAELGAVEIERGASTAGAGLLAQGIASSRAEQDRPRLAVALELLGEIELRQGEVAAASATWSEAAALWRDLGNPRRQASSLAGLARAERAAGRLAEARSHIEEALVILERLRRNYFSEELRATYLASVRNFYELYLDLLLELDRREPQSGHAHAALAASEESRARVLLDLLARSGIDPGADLEPALRERRSASAAALSTTQSALLAARARAAPLSPRLAELEQELARLEFERDLLEGEIRRASAAYADLTLPEPLAAARIQALVPADAALLEYFLGEEHSYLIVATGETVRAFRLAPEREIARAVSELRGDLAQPGRRGFAALLAHSHSLFQTLVAPAAVELAGVRRWLVAPDGVLYGLPFEVLLARPPVADLTAPQPFVVKEREVIYVPSASVLGRLEEPSPVTSPADSPALLAFGDPDYGGAESGEAGPEGDPLRELVRGARDSAGGWSLHRLPATGGEVAGIASLFPQEATRVYLRSAASEENFKRAAAATQARRWHFAAHALVSDERPQDSGLVLALDADPAEDGLLQVSEIFALRMPSDLVVLSACETALGPRIRGEGVIGLSRAFLFAGARALLASLWQVEDRSTADLMVGFYAGLRSGRAPGGALREAKLELLASPPTAHPFYWAPFILTGAPR